MLDLASVRSDFFRAFGGGGDIHIIRAPGRVNLIGEHTDYNDGFVFPMAIEPAVLLACRVREDRRVRIISTAFPDEPVEFSLDASIKPGTPSWGNYCKGVIAEMKQAAMKLPEMNLVGMDALIANSLPVGSGLSSSAAIEVATARAMLTLADVAMDGTGVAMICQKAEHNFAGVPVGIMDMAAVANSRAGHAMLLDCRDRSMQFVPIDSSALRIVIVNTMVRHALTGGEYKQRRAECEAGVAHLKLCGKNVSALRDVTTEMLEECKEGMSEVVYRRCRHVITENARVLRFAPMLSGGKYDEAGKLLAASHASLRDDYEVSCAELDYLVEEAMKVRGVYGARMTGGGFGGCIVALVQPAAVDAFTKSIQSSYRNKFGKTPEVYVTKAAAGCGVVDEEG